MSRHRGPPRLRGAGAGVRAPQDSRGSLPAAAARRPRLHLAGLGGPRKAHLGGSAKLRAADRTPPSALRPRRRPAPPLAQPGAGPPGFQPSTRTRSQHPCPSIGPRRRVTEAGTNPPRPARSGPSRPPADRQPIRREPGRGRPSSARRSQ